MKVSRHFWPFLLVGVFGCSSLEHRQYNPSALGQDVLVIAQVCIPEPESPIHPGWSSVRIGAMGGAGPSKIGTTTRGQPVFENFADTPQSLKAILIWYTYDSQFVFEPPKNISTDTWTEWIDPNYISNKDVGFQILYGKDVKSKTHFGPDAPKLRFRLMRFKDYLNSVGQRRGRPSIDSLPPC